MTQGAQPTRCAWCAGLVNPLGTGSLALGFRDLPGEPQVVWHVVCASRDPVLRALMRPRSAPASDGEIRLILALVAERMRERGGGHGRG